MQKKIRILKTVVFVTALLPLSYYIFQIVLLSSGAAHVLGADPGKALVKAMGEWTLVLLLITLSISPLRRITGWNGLIRLRRMLGLFCFFYAVLHALSYLTFLLEWRVRDLSDDIVERPYILAGFLAFTGLFMLAATSPRRMMRLLGSNWAKLHRLIYLTAMLAITHLWWLTRADYTLPVIYGACLAFLLGFRLTERKWVQSKNQRQR